jgi:hypothetical protein
MQLVQTYVIGRDSNVLRVDFGREPDPPAPKFPGAAGLRALQGEGPETSVAELYLMRPANQRAA